MPTAKEQHEYCQLATSVTPSTTPSMKSRRSTYIRYAVRTRSSSVHCTQLAPLTIIVGRPRDSGGYGFAH